MANVTTIRYLLPRVLFEKLLALSPPCTPESAPVGGFIFAQFTAPFVIVDSFETVDPNRKYHDRPKAWLQLKRRNIRMLREFKATKMGHNQKPITTVYPFHTHPNGDRKLDLIDQKILEYFGSGVMVICTPTEVVGWYYRCLEINGRRKKEWILMTFEIIEEVEIKK